MSADGKPSFLRSSMASGGCAIEEKGNDASTAKTVPFAVVSCSSQVHSPWFLPVLLRCVCHMRGCIVCSLQRQTEMEVGKTEHQVGRDGFELLQGNFMTGRFW